LHKTDQKALYLNIKNKNEFESAVSDLQKRFPGEQIITQEMLSKGNEIILGIKRDSIFGPVVVCGLGGIYTEIFKMVDFFVAPLSEEEVIEKLKTGKIGFLFKQTRGQDPCSAKEVSKIIISIMQMAQEVDVLKEFDINPLILYSDGRKAIAVDVKIIF